MNYQIKKYSINSISITENLHLNQETCFYKFNEFIENNVSYATYVCVLPYSKKDYYAMNRFDRSFIYVILPTQEMIVVFKDYHFLNEEPPLIHSPFIFDTMYLECGRSVNGVYETKEMYKLIEFTGYGFDVIKVTFKDPLTDQEIPSISREIIDLPTLFRDQKGIDIFEADALCTDFMEQHMFDYFYNFVLSLINYEQKESGTNSDTEEVD